MILVISNCVAIASYFQRAGLLEEFPPTGFLIHIHSLLLSGLGIGGHYGLFAAMTKIRNEVLVDVDVGDDALSNDDVDKSIDNNWVAVEWAFKPGNPYLAPKPVWPPFHMPRMDWRLWFVALTPKLSSRNLPPWLLAFLISVLEGDRAVLSLLHPSLNPSLAQCAANRTSKGSGKDMHPRPPLFPVGIGSASSAAAAKVSPRAPRIRVRLACYTFAQSPTPSSACWNVTSVVEILKPCTLEELYFLVVGSSCAHPTEASSVLDRVPPALRPQTVEQMIQRALLKDDLKTRKITT